MSQTSTDLLDVLVSEGYGIFTQVTSILNSLTQTSTSPTATTISDSSSSEASSESPASLTSSLASATSSLASSLTSSDSANAAASSTAAAASSTPSASQGQSGGGGGPNKLALILGCVLGALALGLLILAVLLCCRRRRRKSRSNSVRHGTLLPGDDELDSWRGNDHFNDKRYSSSKEMVQEVTPFNHDHSAFRSSHDNPFVPVPPPPRKSAPNSRAGLTDGTVPGEDPYLMHEGTERPISLAESRSRSNSGHGKALALGAGGAALGAAALHHHHKDKNHSDEDMDQHTISRKPVPVKSVNGGEAWPYEPPPPLQDTGAAAVGVSPRQSFDSSRSRPSRDAARANATFDQEYNAPAIDQEHHHPVAAKTAAALGAGALGGAALAHHHNKKQRLRDSDTSDASQDPTLVADARQDSDLSNTSSESRRYYADALTRHQPGMHELPSNIPPTPPTRERRNSAFGAGAPAAAVGSYFTPPPRPRSRSRSHSSNRRASFPEHPDDYGRHHRPQSQPPVPSRSPARHSFAPSSVAGTTSEYGDIPVGYQPRSNSPLYESKAIVGDNGYPHMNVPRRKSGGEYDYSHNSGGMGPQAPVPPPTRPGDILRGTSDQESRHTSDDSTWRLSMGMPGGWQRAPTVGRSREQTPRGSLDGWGSPVSPVGGSWEGVRGGPGGGRLRRSQLAEGAMQQRGGYEDGGYVSGVGQAL